MASKIQGLTITIGADTKKFQNALKEVEAEARNISKNLKAVDENLKLDPSNAKKAAESLDLLQKNAQKAEEKVKLIKDAIAKLDDEYKNGKVSADDYRSSMDKLKILLGQAQAEQDLANEKVNQFGKEAGEAGKSAVSLGEIIKGNLISKAILSGLESLWKLAVKVSKALWETAKDLFEFSKQSVGIAAQYRDAVEYSEKVFGGYAEKVQKWVKENSQFLRIGISDLQVYANNLGTAFGALGLSRDKTVKFTEDIISLSADIRAATGKDINEIVDALTRGFTSSTRNFRQFGLFVSEADIKIQALKDGVVEYSGDQEALNKLMENYATAAKKAEEAMNTYGEESEQFISAEEEANAAMQELNDLLGQEEINLTSSERATALYNIVMERLGFLVGQNKDEQGLYNSQLALLKTNFDNLKLAIGEKLLPVFTEFLTKFNDFIGSAEGQEIIDSIVEAFEKLAKTLSQKLEDGSIKELLDSIIESAPDVIKNIGDFTTKIIDLIPQIADLVDKLLSLFGIKTEAEEAKQAFMEVSKQVEATADQYGVSLETIQKAVNEFSAEHNVKVSDIYKDWETYAPQIAEMIQQTAGEYESNFQTTKGLLEQFASDNELSLSDIYSNWETYEPQIAEAAKNMGSEYDTQFQATLAVLKKFAEDNGLELGHVLAHYEEYEPQINSQMETIVSDAEVMESSYNAHVSKMDDDLQDAVNDIGSVDLSPYDNRLAQMNQTAEENMERLKGIWEGAKLAFQSLIDFIASGTEQMAQSNGYEGLEDAREALDDWYNERYGGWGKLFGGSNAQGGAVKAGRMYRVNDDAGRRTEWFVPNQDGYILNGNQTDRIVNNNNSRNFSGGINIYVNSYGTNVAEVADELGAAMNRKLRMSGAIL